MIGGRIVVAAAALGLGLGALTSAQGEPYPARPIKIIVPTPAGGPVDVIGRLVANHLATANGQTVVVDNRPGAGNTIGSKEAAQAEPDGYTLLYSSASGLVLAPMLQKNAGYDPITSYDPIALVAQSSTILVVHPSVPAHTVAELVAHARANPGKVNFSSGGIGVLPHLIGEWFKSRAGIDIVHVPYRGGGPSINDLVGGQVQMTFEGVSVLRPLIESGKLIASFLSRFRVGELDRAVGAGAHAARDRRPAQCADQRRRGVARIHGRARAPRQRAAGRNAAGLRQPDQGRYRQVGAGGEGARAEGGMTPRGRSRRADQAPAARSPVAPSRRSPRLPR